MNDECKLALCIGFAASLIISAIAWPIVWWHFTSLKIATDNGYEQGTVQGASGLHWVKKGK